MSKNSSRNTRAQRKYNFNLFYAVEDSLEKSLDCFGGDCQELKQDRAMALMLLNLMQSPNCPKAAESMKRLQVPRVILDVLPREEFHYEKTTAGSNYDSLQQLVKRGDEMFSTKNYKIPL